MVILSHLSIDFCRCFFYKNLPFVSEFAKEIETSRENGEVTGDQVKKLIASTSVYLKDEAKTNRTETKPNSLEQAAREVVESRKKKSGKMSFETLDSLTADNQPIYVDEVKQVTGFGDRGARVVTGLANRNGVTFRQAVGVVDSAYRAGLTGLKKAQVNFDNKLQETAFEAGMVDRVMQDTAKQVQAKKASVYDGVFTENEHTKNFSKAEKK